MKTLFLSLLSALILSACATPPKTTKQTSYKCSDDHLYTAFFYQDKNQTELLNLSLPDGKSVTLVNVAAASGSRYTGETYEWWTKGETALFSNKDTHLECHLIKNK